MAILGPMNTIEKLGAFYLGRSFDLERQKASADAILYDSKNLTTHAVIVSMKRTNLLVCRAKPLETELTNAYHQTEVLTWWMI